jgi:hypothetical protein
LDWLKAQGYKISRATLYRAIQDGLLLVEADGAVTMAAVERYVALGGLTRPAADSVDAAIAADRKTAEEIRQLELKNARLEHELNIMRGKYVEKSAAEAEKADLAALMDALPRHVLTLNLPRYLSAVGADSTKAQLFFGLFDEDFTSAVNRACDLGVVDVEGE